LQGLWEAAEEVASVLMVVGREREQGGGQEIDEMEGGVG
jgi:hypothetical protein